jgi:hypothetical protein
VATLTNVPSPNPFYGNSVAKLPKLFFFQKTVPPQVAEIIRGRGFFGYKKR